jgi:hypothetical protein
VVVVSVIMFSTFVVLIASGFFSVTVFPEAVAVIRLVVCFATVPAASAVTSAVVATVGIEVATVMFYSPSSVVCLTTAIVLLAIRVIERVVFISCFELGCIGF